MSCRFALRSLVLQTVPDVSVPSRRSSRLCQRRCAERSAPGAAPCLGGAGAAEAFVDLEKPFQSQTACRVVLIKIQDKPLIHLDSIYFLWSWFSRLDQGQTQSFLFHQLSVSTSIDCCEQDGFRQLRRVLLRLPWPPAQPPVGPGWWWEAWASCSAG